MSLERSFLYAQKIVVTTNYSFLGTLPKNCPIVGDISPRHIRIIETILPWRLFKNCLFKNNFKNKHVFNHLLELKKFRKPNFVIYSWFGSKNVFWRKNKSCQMYSKLQKFLNLWKFKGRSHGHMIWSGQKLAKPEYHSILPQFFFLNLY